MRGGSSSSQRRGTTRLQCDQTRTSSQDQPSTNEGQNINLEQQETIDLHRDQQQEDTNAPLSQDQPQEDLDFMGRLHVIVVADCLQPSEKCSRRITKITKQKLDQKGASFQLVSEDTKKLYFEEFKKHFVWDAAIDTLVEKAFYQKAKLRYRDFISQIKKAPKPEYIPQLTWDEWEKWWKSPKADAASKRNSKNRRCGNENAPAPSTHVCGSVTYATTEKRLEEQTQKPPTTYQLFVHSHTLGHDGERFITDKARDVNNRMLALVEERRAAGATDIDEDQLFFEVVGGRKRKRIYALGPADHLHYPEAFSSFTVDPKDIEDRVTQKVSELRPRLESEIRENITAEIREQVTAEFQKSVEENMAEYKREIAQMKEMMTKFLSQHQQ